MTPKTSSPFRRYIGATLAASAMTTGLFLVMHSLSANDEIVLDAPKRVPIPTVTQDIKEPEPKKRERITLKKIDVVPPPVLSTPKPPIDDQSTVITPGPTTFKQPPKDDQQVGLLSSSGLMIIANFSPTYPSRAIQNSVEGYCIVSVTVNEYGLVDPASIEVTEEVPTGYFKKSCMDGISRFKFQPQIVDGQRVATENVTYRFSFKLPKE